ncbi:MAG: hypothetical protein HUU20_10445 [Pirellulales bacterium]|nr:hypothetical protein [Pirellulales bacterium]
MFERHDLTTRFTRPGSALAAGLIASLMLMLLPDHWTAAAKSVAASLLKPGQTAVRALREPAARLHAGARHHFRTAAQLAAAQQEIEQLREENRRLQARLAAARGEARAAVPDAAAADCLLGVACVEACVLGQQARVFLARRHLLDAGSRQHVEPNDLVLGSAPGLIDRGSDAELQPGQLALGGGIVWGKIVEVGRHTSTVRAITEPGYRDLVRLAGSDSDDPRSGPQGILEGTGKPFPRIRLIEVTEPVAVGDAVYTAADEGVLPRPLLYGHVVRVERPVGAAHWEIWMQPAVKLDRLQKVTVLRTVLNPAREK